MMDLNTRRRVCELVLGVIATDNELHPAEFQFIVKVFDSFGISQGKAEEVIAPTVRGFEAAKAIKELPAEVRQETLTLLIESAVADGKVVGSERKFLHEVGRAVDVSSEDIDVRVAAALERVTGKPPQGEGDS